MLVKTRVEAVTKAAGISAIILVIVAGLAGYTVSNLTQRPQRLTTTTATSTATITEINLEQSIATETITKAYPQKTITEYLILASGTDGGGAFCEGNLSAPSGCQGGATLHLTYSNSTRYILPLDASREIINATIFTFTSYSSMTCGNATTTTTTMSYNSTSGYGWVQWTWSQTCR